MSASASALARAGVGIAAVPDRFAAPSVRSGELRQVLPDWHLPAHPAWAVFPGRRLMPAKTRAFLDMLQTTLAGASGNAARLPANPLIKSG
jgi:DNA-binding transcriptional LysR family regulator